MNIKNDTFTDFDTLLNRVKELSEVIRWKRKSLIVMKLHLKQ
jgi:hypothetical protein